MQMGKVPNQMYGVNKTPCCLLPNSNEGFIPKGFMSVSSSQVTQWHLNNQIMNVLISAQSL